MIRQLTNLVKRENFVASIIFIVMASFYHTTMCPTVSFTDSGELATVATTLGIAHPTGYPLWTLIGRIAVMTPLGGQEITHLNTFASILTALAVSFFFKLMLVIYRSRKVFGLQGGETQNAEQWFRLLGALVTALIVGFSSTVWAQSVEIEVYALHVLLIGITSIFFVSGIEHQLSEPRQVSQRLLFFAFVLGLSFTNHLTTILLAPGFLYLYFASLGFNKRSWQLIAVLVPFFLLGLSVYVYLPLRALGSPLLDWGHPVTLQRFWWHVTGKQYQTWMFAGADVMQKQLHYFLTNFPDEFQWPVIALLVLGVIIVFNRSKRFLMFMLLLFVACVVYSINFDIHEIDPYFLLAYVACACIIGVAVQSILKWSWNRNLKFVAYATTVILVSLPVVQIVGNRSDVDQSKNYQALDFVEDVFSQLEPNAVVFSSLWDYFVSPSYYYQIVRKERPDVVIIDEELLKNRTWYFTQIERDHPGVFGTSKLKAEAFLQELRKFEKGEPFEFATIKSRWDDMLQDLVGKLLRDHPVYVDARITPDFTGGFEPVPQGLLVRLKRKGEEGEWKPITSQLKGGTFSNYVTSDLRRYYASMYTYHSFWLFAHNRPSVAMQNLHEALQVDPNYLPAMKLKNQITIEGG